MTECQWVWFWDGRWYDHGMWSCFESAESSGWPPRDSAYLLCRCCDVCTWGDLARLFATSPIPNRPTEDCSI